MAKAEARKITITVDEEQQVSGLLVMPQDARALYVLAHGAGAGMTHPFLATMATLLADRGIATLRYQFAYMEKGSRRPDPPKVAEATVRAAVTEAAKQAPRLPLFAGGKSFGGRMTSQAEAHGALGVKGLSFLGFPLHPPGAPADTRGEHLTQVKVPMLFLQGTRDEFADLSPLKPLAKRLGKRATLHLIDDANHSFRVPATTGRKEADVMAELADTLAKWFDGLAGQASTGHSPDHSI
jgi:predicted alpha/beta-hydrolase family hydrolase